jgi:hypothetical protein
LIYQYSIMICCTFARFLMPCPASGRRAYQSCTKGNRQLACLSSHSIPKRYAVGIPVCLAKKI